MTVSTTTDRQYFSGDGANKNFPFNFPFFSNSQIYVWLVAANGTLTAQVESTNYTLTGAGSPNGGGQVTMIVAPPGTSQLLVQRILPFTQETSVRNQEDFYPEVHEEVFDKLTMLLQQLFKNQSDISLLANRSVRVPLTDTVIPALPNVAGRALKYLSFDAAGNPVATSPATGSVEALVATLISTAGAAFIGSASGNGVQADLNNRITVATIGSASGASIVGTSRASTVEAELTALLGRSAPNTIAVASIAALRLLSPAGVDMVITNGYYAAGDTGGGAIYRPVPGDTATADNGGSVIVGVGGIRWYLVHNGSVNIEQFGAKPDNTTNVLPRIQAMLAVPSIREITFGGGPYLFSGSLTLGNNKSLRGIRGAGTSVTVSGATTIILNQATYVGGFTFECTNQPAGNYLFLLDTGTNSMEYITVEDINLYHMKGFMTDGNHATNVATNVRIRNISSRLTKGPGFLLRDVFAFLEMRDIAMDFVGNVAAQNFTGFSISFNEGCLLENCEMTGTTGLVAGTNAGQIGFSFTSCKAVYMKRCFADACGGIGWYFSSCQYIRIEQGTASLCDSPGLYLISSTDILVNNFYAGGRKGIGGATASVIGVYVNACTRVMLCTIEAINCTGDGIQTASTTSQLNISNSILSSNLGRGLVTGAGSVSITSNTLFVGNTAGNYSLATAVDHLSGCQNSGGSLLNITGPGAA